MVLVNAMHISAKLGIGPIKSGRLTSSRRTSSSRRHFEGRSWQGLHRLRPVSIECLGRAADDRGRVLLDRAWHRPVYLHIGRVNLEVPRNSDCPGQVASRESLAERRAKPIPGIRQHAAAAHTGRDDTIDLRQGHLRLRPRRSILGRNTRSLQPRPIPCRASGRNNRKASMIGTSPRPSVSYTSVWELAVLPSAEAYSVATPTECVPFLAIAASSITSTASRPPTSLSAWTSSSVSQALLPRPRRNEVVQLIASRLAIG